MAARHQQQGRGLKQVVVRFNVEQDAALLEWLTPFAASYDMTKVIRLACYALAGLEPEQGLLALLPAIKKRQNGSGPRMQRSPAQEVTYDALADVMQELAALRAAVMEQHASADGAYRSAPATDWRREYHEIDPDPAEVVASTGLDMSRRRRGAPARPTNNGWHPPHAGDFDAETSSRLLVKTIREFSTNLQRGQR